MVHSPHLLSVVEIRRIEAAALASDPQPPLMQRAGLALAEQARQMLAELGHGADALAHAPPAVLVLAGPGNNGGDALVAARHLAASGIAVSVILAGDPARLPIDAGRALEDWLAAGGGLAGDWPAQPPNLIIDGLLGIGISRPPGRPIADLILRANRSGVPILAIDVPSGLDADSGAALEPCIRATATLTFLADKPGLHRGEGPACAGVVRCDRLGCEAFAAPD